MPKTRSNFSRRAWSLLRLTLLWARKGGLFRRRLMVELRLVPTFIKNVGHISNNPRDDQISYMAERELSFDKTPVVSVKMHRPHSMRFLVPCIPCINPRIDFDCDLDGDGVEGNAYGYCEPCKSKRKSFMEDAGFEYEHREDDDDEEGDGIDRRAEEFIARFYEQMKLQRQISYLQYNQ